MSKIFNYEENYIIRKKEEFIKFSNLVEKEGEGVKS